MEAYIHFDDLLEVEKFKAWLYRIMTRTAYRAKKRHFWSRMVSIHQDDMTERLPPVYTADENREESDRLYAALSELSVKERSALLLFEIGGFSIKEIALIQDERSLSSVKSRLSRARSRLKSRLEKESIALPKGKQHPDLEQETMRIIDTSHTQSRE